MITNQKSVTQARADVRSGASQSGHSAQQLSDHLDYVLGVLETANTLGDVKLGLILRYTQAAPAKTHWAYLVRGQVGGPYGVKVEFEWNEPYADDLNIMWENRFYAPSP
jgi:hypothetical protein